jgi:branched-chain amino acid transport system substrate-binding protein
VDFTAPVLAMKQAGVDAAVGSFVEASDLAMTTAIKQANLNMKAQLFYTGYGQSILDQPTAAAAAQGDYFRLVTAPAELKSPGTEALLAGLKQYDPNYKGGDPDFGLLQGWLVADLMIRGLKQAGQNPTRDSFIANLTNVTDYDAGGLLPAPVSFNHFGSYEPTLCNWFVQLKGSQFVPVPADGKPTCGKLIPNTNTT